ncbi:hypothetical protein [uncultured Ferrovibrio sp.]|jgi:hypothetical protein|uniref:DUF6969 family protein n=1 Tax=uncultured Ferrovibrio sp. TaxID=1576913 RepID=UPI00261F47CD|nr:hypothetical protein [uncultured Ferrovibrio sp.]
MNMMANLGQARLHAMLNAGLEVLRIQQQLTERRSNLVAELLRGQDEFFEHQHYPPGDVFDPETGAQYYYHSHRNEGREHGHFHIFQRPQFLPESFEPARYVKQGVGRCSPREKIGEHWPRGDKALAHIVGVAMDNYGLPIRLFTVNRWVTDETWFAARDVIAMLDRFELRHGWPVPEVNRWLNNLLRLFQPEIVELIRRRDDAVEARGRANPRGDALEDRSLEITASLDISVERRVRQLRRSLNI